MFEERKKGQFSLFFMIVSICFDYFTFIYYTYKDLTLHIIVITNYSKYPEDSNYSSLCSTIMYDNDIFTQYFICIWQLFIYAMLFQTHFLYIY